MYQPSQHSKRKFKKFTVIFLLSVVVAAIVYTSLHNYTTMDNKNSEDLLDITFLESNDYLAKLDSDKDGVPDWVEKERGLNPLLQDSDGDGISDSDFLRISEFNSYLSIEPVKEELSVTDTIGRFAASSLIGVNDPSEITEETSKEVSDNIEEYLQNLPIGGIIYEKSELNIVPNTKEFSYNYRDAVEDINKKYPLDLDDLNVLLQAVGDKDSYQEQTNRIKQKYDNLLFKLLDLDVPSSIAQRHLDYINSVVYFKGAFENISQVEPDYFVSLSSILQLDEKIANISETADYITLYFELISDESIFSQ